MPRSHRLKCHPPFFEDVAVGRKPFELRRDDRGFATGDSVILAEYAPASLRPEWQHEAGYSGRLIEREISYILRGFPGLEPGYCILGLRTKTDT